MNGRGQSKMNGGKNVEKGSGLGRQNVAAGTQPAEQGNCRQHSRRTLRSAQASKRTNGPQLAGLAAKTTAADQRRPASRRAGKWGEYSGAGSHEGGLRPTYPVPTPPIAFACHCPYPLP